jgi:hypothetical protein
MAIVRRVYAFVRRRWRLVAGLGLGIPAAAVGGFFAYMELVKAGILKYNKYDRRERGSLREGAPAPDLELVGYDGQPARLAAFWSDRPLFLIFGSCT